MTKPPTVTHVHEIGGTRDHNRIKVTLERTATLDSTLRHITARSGGRIHLTVRHGYEDAKPLHLLPEDAEMLADALNEAVKDVIRAKDENDQIAEGVSR